MGENEKLRFPIYFQGQPMCNDVGYITNVPIIEYVGFDTSGKPIYKPKTSCGTIPKQSPTHAERMASLKAEADAMAEKYKPIVDKLLEEICESSQKPIELLSEETTQRINKAFEEMRRKPVDTDFPIALKSAKRKHYKPKFTL